MRVEMRVRVSCLLLFRVKDWVRVTLRVRVALVRVTYPPSALRWR